MPTYQARLTRKANQPLRNAPPSEPCESCGATKHWRLLDAQLIEDEDGIFWEYKYKCCNEVPQDHGLVVCGFIYRMYE